MSASRLTLLAYGLSGAFLLMSTPAISQSFLDLFKKGEGNPFAPVDNGVGAVPPSHTIRPTSPNEGNVKRNIEDKEKPENPSAKASTTKATAVKADPKAKVAIKSAEAEDDEDEDALYEYEEPRRVTITLPLPRPGIRIANAADVAPIGTARWSAGKEQLPPGVDFKQNTPLPNLALPGATRVAALPQTQPSWSSADVQPLRPSGLRDVESPVANMPGVYAPPEANFQCLPAGVKQVLVDTAKRFGHVAILNAKRPRGTGARGSYHYQCRAVDFRVRGVPVRTVYNFLKEHPNVGGRKIYPFGFFHVDDGPVRSW